MDPRIAFPCPNCQQRLKIKQELAGKTVCCPRCQQPIQVPQPAASATPVPTGQASGSVSVGEGGSDNAGSLHQETVALPLPGSTPGTLSGQQSQQHTLSLQDRLGTQSVGGATPGEHNFLA